MNIKRTVGTGKIFWYSCGVVIALAGVVWLIINGIYAVYISGEEPEWSWYYYDYTKTAADIATPWLLMAASMAICYRYMKMCSANNISCTKQTAIFSLLSVFVSTVFAAADLLTAKLVMQPLYGGIITTRFEADNTYFRGIIRDYVRTFEEDIPQTLSPYTMNALLMIFALMAVYYYCFFITGCYIMQCFRYGRKKTLIYYAVAAVLLALLAFAVDETDLKLEYMTLNYILAFTTLLVLIVGFLTNPIIFLYFVPSLAEEIIDMSDISVLFFDMMITFILITIASVEILGSKQFSSKKRIKRIRKNYLAKNNCGEEGTSQ